MPYKVQGNKVLQKEDRSWVVKKTCTSHEAAVETIRLFYAIEKNLNSKPNDNAGQIDERNPRQVNDGK